MGNDLAGWTLDPNDPRAPSLEQWDRLSEAERAQVVAALPTVIAGPPQGDFHNDPATTAKETLRDYFRRTRRPMYVGGDMGVYYPHEAVFCPDVFAVLDAGAHPRSSWNVLAEGRKLDFVIEVHVEGDWKKDAIDNVVRYARLGISEYFLFDVRRERLAAWRLPDPSARRYEPQLAQAGKHYSSVLALDLSVEGGGIRFSSGQAPLLAASELVTRLEGLVSEAHSNAAARADLLESAERRAEEEKQRAAEEQQRAAEEKQRAAEERQRAAEEKQRAAEEKQRADAAEARLAEALAELERLRKP